MIRHRACSLRDNAYALIKAELDSDFEDKCREISKIRRVPADADKNQNTNARTSKNESNAGTTTEGVNKSEKTQSPGGSVVSNGRKLSTSRKRKVPAWARGYVKKVTKKKKILFDESVNESPIKGNNGTRVVDLQKFQEFEANVVVLNGGDSTIYDNTESDNDSVNNEGTNKEVVIGGSQVEVISDNSKTVEDKSKEVIVDVVAVDVAATTATSTATATATATPGSGAGPEERPTENGESHSSSRRESTDDLTFAVDCDSSPKKMGEERVVVDRGELEDAWRHTVQVTRDLPVEVLCDIYVQLSRSVGKYDKSYERKTLPKVIDSFYYLLRPQFSYQY